MNNDIVPDARTRAIYDIRQVLQDKKMYINEKNLYIKSIDLLCRVGYYSNHKSILVGNE
jgi:hypothetical protein